jgi:hypothetical protein
MADFTPQVFRVPQCSEPEVRQALERIRDYFVAIKDGDTIQITVENADKVDGEHAASLHDAAQLTGNIALSVLALYYVEGTLGSDLASGGTQVVDTRTISGKAIRALYEIPSGATFGAIWNGTNYTLIWANQCERLA